MQKKNIPQAESQSADLIQENIEQLKQIFPEVIKEGRVDFDALNDLLGNYADIPEERFYLNWAGKVNARREAQKRSTGTLRPCPEESLDWDTTENLYIEGDNLEVLKLLQKSYHSRVKMIYIDPPYNTGKDFVYKDNYSDNMKNYLEQTGQDKKLSTNTESDGRYHSNWLNMMYPRLKLSRNLLAEDGVIFISIDDNEVANLRKICDEIFGEENFLAQIIHKNNSMKNQSKFIGVTTEYAFVYAKNFSILNTSINGWRAYKKGASDVIALFQNLKDKGVELDEIQMQINELYSRPKYSHLSRWNKVDQTGVFTDKDLSRANGYKDFTIINPYTNKECIIPDRGWGKKYEDLLELQRRDMIWYGDGTTPPREKSYMTNERDTVFDNYFFADNSIDKKMLVTLLGGEMFEFPKSLEMIKQFISLATSTTENSIILDFFSGSATTAHAVMQLNAEDGGNRKYICVQLPEPTPEDSEARKAGYNTIPEIAKERIRRAGKKILEEQKAKAEKEGGLFAEGKKKLDIGFKVFKLDSSNINAWDNTPANLETALHNSLFNIKTDRSEEDLLYEILIKYGIELTQKINRHTIAGKTVYEMGAGSLIVCLADNLTTEVAEGIGKLYEEVSSDGIDGNCRVVFKDSGFNGSDEVKTNTLLILKQHGITNVASV